MSSQLMMVNSVRMTVMAAQMSSVLRAQFVMTYKLLGQGLSAQNAHLGLLETHISAMVSFISV